MLRAASKERLACNRFTPTSSGKATMPLCRSAAVSCGFARMPTGLTPATAATPRVCFRCCAQTAGTHARHCGEDAAPLFHALGFVQIRDALPGHDVTHIVAVDHHRSDGHSCLLADRDCIQRLDERRYSTLCKCLYGLNDQFSSPRGRTRVCLKVEARWATW